MKKRKNIIKIAIDSPAASGAGTLSRAISKQYNLLAVDTGKAYRLIALYKIKFPNKFNLNFLKKRINKLNIKDLNKKELSCYVYHVFGYKFNFNFSWYRSFCWCC